MGKKKNCYDPLIPKNIISVRYCRFSVFLCTSHSSFYTGHCDPKKRSILLNPPPDCSIVPNYIPQKKFLKYIKLRIHSYGPRPKNKTNPENQFFLKQCFVLKWVTKTTAMSP